MEPRRYQYSHRVEDWNPFLLKPGMFIATRTNVMPPPEILLLKESLEMEPLEGLNSRNIGKIIPSLGYRYRGIGASSRQGRDNTKTCSKDTEGPASRDVLSSVVPLSRFEHSDCDNSCNLHVPNRYSLDRNASAVTPLSGKEQLRAVKSNSIDHHDASYSDPRVLFHRRQKKFREELLSKGAKVVQVLYPIKDRNTGFITVARGEFLEVLDDSHTLWKARNYHGKVFDVHRAYLKPVAQ